MANKKKTVTKKTKKVVAKKAIAKKVSKPSKISKTSKTVAKIAVKNSKVVSSDIKFSPLNDRVLVEREEALTKTSGGLFIPDTATDAPPRGVVISVGPGKIGKKGQVRPTDVVPGQRVIFNKYAGNEIKLGSKNYIILNESDIIGIVEE